MSEEKVELTRVGSLCSPDPQIQLLDAWTSRDFSTFCNLLEKPGVSADHWYDDPHLATCLYLTSKEEDGAEYARALLQARAEPNNMNGIRMKAPIHVAAAAANVEVLKVLLSDPRTDVNIKDNFGNTALHTIAKQKRKDVTKDIDKYKDCIRLLLNHSKIDPNLPNKRDYSAVHFAAENDAKEVVQTILENAGDGLDVDNKRTLSESARDIIGKKYPEFGDLLPERGRDGDTKTVDSNTLFQYLYRRKLGEFTDAVEMLPHEQLEANDGNYTLLQYCAENGLEEQGKALLDRKVNRNATCKAEPRPPALLACYGGHPAIFKLLIGEHPELVNIKDANSKRGTAFHAVLDSPRADTSTVTRDYRGCLDLLLMHFGDLKIDINAVDLKGNTALHYAAKNADDYAVLSLLKRGAYIGIKNVFGELPLASIPPKTLEAFLNDCLNTNDELPREDTYEVSFSYKFLVPPARECCMQEQQNSHMGMDLPLFNSRKPPARRKMSTATTETEPLLYISQSRDLRYLLRHPIFTSFLDLKWHHIRIFFYINLIFYILFVALLTLYILLSFGKPHIIDSGRNSDNTTAISKDATEEPGGEALAVVRGNMSDLWRAFSIVFLSLLILREVFQLVVGPLKYLRSPENYLEFLLLIMSASILFCEWVQLNARPHFSALTILLSWAELVLLIGRHPHLSTNIEMFKTVSWNFLKFLAWYAILIIAFALSFYTLFRDCGTVTECGEGGDSNDNFFLDPGMSVFKTVVMLTGEFDATSIPFVSFPGTSHIVFVLFVFLIAIVLFNLLNGLAVSDTQAIRDDAEIVGYIARVKLLSHIETLFQSSSVPLLEPLKCMCCFWPTGSNCFKSINKRVCLFPDKVPDNKIRVFPNRGLRIIFTSHQKKCQEEEEGSRCCLDGCRACTLDSGILERAIGIINNRGKVSEMEEMKIKLDRIEDMLKSILKQTEHLNSNSKYLENI
ncbi:Transient receptor potential cation channel protein painless [Cryptotermes secundus]|nr:transient receptor potential cation channel protein painless isoform X2 [Cryptotermes secundus]PNF26761.1 Transient receptor potential cation channel protein painless [Cryptotermes secundus]